MLAQAKADPAETCRSSLHTYLAIEQFGLAIPKEHAAGHDCGIVNITGEAPFYFTYKIVQGLPQMSGGFTPRASSRAADCVTVSLPPVPLTTSMLTACKVDPQHAIVYVLDGASGAATCAKNGYTLWD
ncbi:hypothetical protein AX769_03615 [Frondihabitans sp. PAMC 28766]|nr:hypothetical protein AX769_03615 [Frondihabitans sp. PAMC 28766]